MTVTEFWLRLSKLWMSDKQIVVSTIDGEREIRDVTKRGDRVVIHLTPLTVSKSPDGVGDRMSWVKK